MASVKQLKSKGRAVVEVFDFGLDRYVQLNTMYELRKQQFADTGPAKIVKPVRHLKHKFQAELAAWACRVQDAVAAGKLVPGADGACLPYPHVAEDRYKIASRLNGHPLVQRIAAWA